MMKNIFTSVIIAFSMFSKIPVPTLKWEKESMKYMLCALPLVGIIIGAALCLWTWICTAAAFGHVFFAAGMTAIPLLISGGIHMDGFCDTVDALSSHGNQEKKRNILKDPHAGAFAVIFAVIYIMVYFAAVTEVTIAVETALFVGTGHVLARSLGAFAGTVFPVSSSRGTLAVFADSASRKSTAVLIIWMILCVAAMVMLNPAAAILCAAASIVCNIYVRHVSRKHFGGMSGDLAGYLVTVAELVFVICYVIGEKVIL